MSPKVALSGHSLARRQCLLSGVEQTFFASASTVNHATFCVANGANMLRRKLVYSDASAPIQSLPAGWFEARS
jgi:hypothetical protein